IGHGSTGDLIDNHRVDPIQRASDRSDGYVHSVLEGGHYDGGRGLGTAVRVQTWRTEFRAHPSAQVGCERGDREPDLGEVDIVDGRVVQLIDVGGGHAIHHRRALRTYEAQ